MCQADIVHNTAKMKMTPAKVNGFFLELIDHFVY